MEASYESRGAPADEAERRAWATVNKDDGGGKKPGGSGRGKTTGDPASHRGGAIGGEASASRPASAKKRRRRAGRRRDAEAPFAEIAGGPPRGKAERPRNLRHEEAL